MVITTSIVVTCIVLILINSYAILKDSKSKRESDTVFLSQLSDLNSEIFYMKQDIHDVKVKADGLEKIVSDIASDPAHVNPVIFESEFNRLDKKLQELERFRTTVSSLNKKVDTALYSINTIQAVVLKK